MDLKDLVLSQIQEEEVIKLTQELVKIPSYAGVEGVETKVAQYIADFLNKEGIIARVEEIFEGRCNVYASLGNGKGKSLLLCGHIDTVAPNNMAVEPFEAYIKDGLMYGRGTSDMKGGIATMVMAMVALKRAGVELNGEVKLAGVVGEESPNTSEGARALVASGKTADMAIVGEATNLEIAAAHKGMEWLKIEVKGKAAHGSVPEKGVNAILKAAKIISVIESEIVPKLKERKHPLVGQPTINIGRINGGILNNIVPESCWFSLDRRWIPGETLEQVIGEIKEIINKLKKEDPELDAFITEESETIGRCPMEIDIKHPLINILSDSIDELLKVKPNVMGVVYWTDGAHLANAGVPTVVFGPGDIAQAHASIEYIEVSQLIKAARIYALTALKICK